MFPIRWSDRRDDDRARIAPIAFSGSLSHEPGGLAAEIAAPAQGFGAAGEVRLAPRPLRRPEPARIGAGEEADWRAARAAVSRTLAGDEPARVVLARTLLRYLEDAAAVSA